MNSSGLPGLGDDVVCKGCDKAIYHSSTGCLCPPGTNAGTRPMTDADWKGLGPRTLPSSMSKSDSPGALVCPSCGGKRKTASKDPNRVMPCSNCKAGPYDLKDLKT
uniref:Uncharacterized protein n=1 Tax=Chromera velia CCMP2878 TaxID=1169474 RepID=A0A0G4IFV9_9ALVE|eukprot:Cvel_14010.t1-p1 / transcript=Cvel_14010.t1 / gene=Cvel_14010 / organism=Chromera_velia_CCMP2878 / gene_product=hypothetical protein / transcript_product=hypothetical protein / location=Cvel_scaffold980:40838-42229(+) / protein_length=105 / sequence_SO=supercontig / SO=protein_coding / is_pseudo=false